MKRHKLLLISLSLALFLAVLNFVALEFYFYWTIWWFDILMHFLGGFTLGFFFLYLFFESSFRGRVRVKQALILSFVLTMVLGGAWEVFEYYFDLSLFTEKYDTIYDLILDGAGAIFALAMMKRSLKVS